MSGYAILCVGVGVWMVLSPWCALVRCSADVLQKTRTHSVCVPVPVHLCDQEKEPNSFTGRTIAYILCTTEFEAFMSMCADHLS